MGREIRRVPANWDHPRTNCYGDNRYKPLHEGIYQEVAVRWVEGCLAWSRGEHEDKSDSGCQFYWEYYGNPPDESDYTGFNPDKLGDEAWFQVYETVSEGTPVAPPFATKESLIDYLCTNGDFWDQRRGDGPWTRMNAEKFVNDHHGFAVSLVITREAGTVPKIFAPRDGQP